MDWQGGVPLSCFSNRFAFWLCMMTKPMLWGPDPNGIVPVYWLAKKGIWGQDRGPPGLLALRQQSWTSSMVPQIYLQPASACHYRLYQWGFCLPPKHNSGFQVTKILVVPITW